MVRFALAAAALGLVAGCAHAAAEAPPREERDVVVVDSAPQEPIPAEAPAPSRRISKTITLGQTDSSPMAQAPVVQGGPGVVVNNNITVVTGPPVVYGGYYGYGYGYGYGGGGAHAAPNAPYVNHVQGGAPIGSPASVGVGSAAGAPPVGGNWPSAPSYGPRTNR